MAIEPSVCVQLRSGVLPVLVQGAPPLPGLPYAQACTVCEKSMSEPWCKTCLSAFFMPACWLGGRQEDWGSGSHHGP